MSLETLNTLTIVWIFVGVVSFPFLLKVTQPYGRHISNNWGPLISNKIGWVVQETPSMFFLVLFFLLGTGIHSKVSYFLIGLWVLHYIYRSWIFPFRTKTEGKKIPLAIVCSAILFNFVNGFLNGYWFGNFADFADDYFTSPRFIVGILIFIAGVLINHQSDNILLALRKPGETGYKIPYGGFFKFISCPNHFGEIIEWAGFAVLVGSWPAWSFAVWAVVNLVPRALDHHRWYKKQFVDYPKDRKAVIPFLL